MAQKMVKKKVVFLIRDLNYGGAQRQLVTLVKGIEKDKFDVSVIVFYSNGFLEKDLKEQEINLISLNKSGRWGLISFFWQLIKHIKQLKPDVLHGYLGDANSITILLKFLFPSTQIIWGVRDSIANCGQADNDWLANALFKLECFLSPFADLIIVNSRAGRELYSHYSFPLEKMVVIPNGINTERFCPDSDAGIKVRAEWGVSQNKFLIGLIGRLNPMKDYPNFIQTASILSHQRQDVHFVCVGTGVESYAQELYNLTEKFGISDRVIWAGARADMPAVYNALDIVVSASAYGEGFPNIIGEAMACGIPCVVTDVGDSAWIVGDAGVVVPPKSSEALAIGCNSLMALTVSNRAALKEKARKKIVEHFSVAKLVQTTQAYLLSSRLNNKSTVVNSVLVR